MSLHFTHSWIFQILILFIKITHTWLVDLVLSTDHVWVNFSYWMALFCVLNDWVSFGIRDVSEVVASFERSKEATTSETSRIPKDTQSFNTQNNAIQYEKLTHTWSVDSTKSTSHVWVIFMNNIRIWKIQLCVKCRLKFKVNN